MDPLLGYAGDAGNYAPSSHTELPLAQEAEVSAAVSSGRPHELTTQQDRVQRESLLSRRGFMSLTLLGMGIGCLLAMTYMYGQGWYALVVHGSDPCDVPLSKWLAFYLFYLPTDVDFVACRIRPWIYRTVCCWQPAFPGDEPPWRVRALQFLYFFGVFEIYSLGFTMLASSKTCARTAPELYGWVEDWLSLGLLLWFLFHAFTACSILMIHSLAIRGTRGAHPETVNHMETIQYKAAELWDGEDGRPSKECCICMESYSEQQDIKRTSCNHIFHAACLRNWLTSQRSCPLCRIDLERAAGLLRT